MSDAHTHKQIYKGLDVVKLSELFKAERTNDKTIKNHNRIMLGEKTHKIKT
jgi:hypothetical protein